jgi:phospho-N-acetylmuramoyl-pentapeptide-transferase
MFIPAILWLMFGAPYIAFLKEKTFGQYIREDGPQSHHAKAGTPTMGGLLIILTVLLAMIGFIFIEPALQTTELFLCLLVLMVFGFLGFTDDIMKITKQKNKGLSGWSKLAVQVITGAAIGLYAMSLNHGDVSVFGFATLHLGWLYPVLAIFIITGASNAYNLTDGLDGLAGGTGFMTFAGFSFLLASYPSMMLLSLLLAGGCLGFLAFNRYPAKIFMGDTGSLALGGVMGVMAILGHVEAFLVLLGGVYVLETLSVILQVAYFKLTKGKRLFKMSPLHHHFELSGWKEPTVVITFIVAQALFSVLAVLLYNRS